jgi:cell division GTPase FtsZ
MGESMAHLLIGIGGFGSNILRHIHDNNQIDTLPIVFEMLLIHTDGQSVDYPFPAVETTRNLAVIDSNTSLKTTEELMHRINTADRIIVFAGIGGGFTCEVLHEMIHSSSIDQTKGYIAAISPFSFEGRAKAAIAKETLKTIIDAQIGCGIFANDDLIEGDYDHQEVVQRMKAFNEKIIASIPW